MATHSSVLACTNLVDSHRPKGRAIQGPQLHRIKAFLSDKTNMGVEIGRLQKPLEGELL